MTFQEREALGLLAHLDVRFNTDWVEHGITGEIQTAIDHFLTVNKYNQREIYLVQAAFYQRLADMIR